MKAEYDLTKMKSRRNPYVRRPKKQIRGTDVDKRAIPGIRQTNQEGKNRQMNPHYSLIVLLGLAAIASAVMLASAAEGPKIPSDGLTIIDLDGTKVQLTPDDLRKLPAATEKQRIRVCADDSHFEGVSNYSGVHVSDVLSHAKNAQACGPKKKLNLFLIFRGTDGYQAITTWYDVNDAETGKRALVALEKNNAPLPDDEGKLRLILPGDKFVEREVKCLASIQVCCAEGFVEKKKK